MRRVGVNVKNVMTNVIISERNDINIMMVKNVFTKEKTERFETNVYICNDSWRIIAVQRKSCKCDPIGMMARSHERFALAVRGARNFSYFGPAWRDLWRVKFETGVSLVLTYSLINIQPVRIPFPYGHMCFLRFLRHMGFLRRFSYMATISNQKIAGCVRTWNWPFLFFSF